MAAINRKKIKAPIKDKSSLQALTAAALLLPGMLPTAAEAVEDVEFSFQYGHYEEGKRRVSSIDATNGFSPTKVEVPQELKPIEADSLLTSIKVAVTDRIKFNANFSQDTWAGATPVTTAPAAFGGNRTSDFIDNGIVTGASPVISTFGGVTIFDAQLNPLRPDVDITAPLPGNTFVDTELAHTMTLASPETRKQGDFSLSYEWDEAAINIGGGISLERDYDSRFFNLGGRLDFNRKLTSVDFGASYTNSATKALGDHHATAYLGTPTADVAKKNGFTVRFDPDKNSKWIEGRRQDWGFNLGLTQIVNKNAFFKLSGAYTYSDGYMGNPYKAVTTFFEDTSPVAVAQAQFIYGAGVTPTTSRALLEQRPIERHQWHWNLRFVQHIEALAASTHLGYQFSHDDWGIKTHTFDADWVQSVGDGWSITPRVRYYSQSKADFYTPYLVLIGKSMPDHFSSDHRLSGFGAISGGITVKKAFTKGVSLEAGVEYYSHQGKLKLGGDGESDYADFDFYAFNAAINVNMSALGSQFGSHDAHQHIEHGAPLPAGVRFGHMLKQRNQFMVGYRYQYMQSGGEMLHGTNSADDQLVVANGCGADPCYVAPREMAMHMHMVDLMYAPTDWLTLMLMPQFVDKSMDMSELDGSPFPGISTGSSKGIAVSHTKHNHITGGLGDTGMYAMIKLFDNDTHRVHLTVGGTAPTGDADITLRGAHGYEMGYIHYGMQVGSGTWDVKPSLTYTGQEGKWSWGAQVSGTKRLGKNNAGFAFSDEIQASAWGGYQLTNWLNTSVRGIYSSKSTLRGAYTSDTQLKTRNATDPVFIAHVPVGTMDYTSNYGGEYWDVGFGINAFIPTGNFAGNTFSVEWQQPVVDDVNGYQREREGALTVSWSYMF